MGELVDSEEAARRLGIKLSSLYAYVSRGIIESHPASNGRRRLFDVDDLARMNQRARPTRADDTPAIHVATKITELTHEGPVYRGAPAAALATTMPFEEVASLLWGTAEAAEWIAHPLPEPPEVPLRHRIKWSILMADAHGALSSDLRPASIAQMAPRLLATMVAAVATGPHRKPALLDLDGRGPVRDSLAGRLASYLSPLAGNRDVVRAINAALVLFADYELTLPTLAVRVAASGRASFYDSMLVGVSASSSPAHGPSSELTWVLLNDALDNGVVRAMDDALRIHGVVPGFGHTSASNVDPRFDALMPLVESLGTEEKQAVVRSVLGVASRHDLPYPRVDFALSALMFLGDMPRDAGEAIFTIGRSAGWVAHFLEELDEPPLRFRPRPVYVAQEQAPLFGDSVDN